MAKGAKTLTAERAYRAQLNRIRKQIHRMQERGYQLTGRVIPERPSRITKKSVEKLRKITAAEIYKKSVKIEETPEGIKVIKGTEARAAERRESARKAAETRKRKGFFRGVILENIEYMIKTAGSEYYESAQDLQDVIDDNIAKYGRDEVIRLFNEAPVESIEAAQVAIYYRIGSKQHEGAIDNIYRILSGGVIPTMEEARAMQAGRTEVDGYDY